MDVAPPKWPHRGGTEVKHFLELISWKFETKEFVENLEEYFIDSGDKCISYDVIIFIWTTSFWIIDKYSIIFLTQISSSRDRLVYKNSINRSEVTQIIQA